MVMLRARIGWCFAIAVIALLCAAMSAPPAVAGEDDPSTATIAMAGVGVIAGPASVAAIAFNAYRLHEGRPSGAGGLVGLLAGGLTMAAGLTLLSDDSAWSGLMIGVGAGSMVLGGISAARAGTRPDADRAERFNVAPVVLGAGTGALGGGLEIRWRF